MITLTSKWGFGTEQLGLEQLGLEHLILLINDLKQFVLADIFNDKSYIRQESQD